MGSHLAEYGQNGAEVGKDRPYGPSQSGFIHLQDERDRSRSQLLLTQTLATDLPRKSQASTKRTASPSLKGRTQPV